MSEKMTREEILTRVKQVISKTMGISEGDISLENNLQQDLQIDSFSTVEMVFHAEDEFNVSFDNEELQGIATVEDLVKKVEDKLNG